MAVSNSFGNISFEFQMGVFASRHSHFYVKRQGVRCGSAKGAEYLTFVLKTERKEFYEQGIR